MNHAEIIDLEASLDGQKVYQVVLSNRFAKLSLLSFGATLQSFTINVSGYSKRDVVLGYPDWKTYRKTFDFSGNAYMGSMVGPIAGRLGRASLP